MTTNRDAMKVSDTVKLVAMVVLITGLLFLVALNFEVRQPVNLIFGKLEVWPSLMIMVSFALGMLCTLLVLLIRRARTR
jgi:uncharacterized integral membrane protein